MGQGVGRVWRPPAPRVERARPFSDEFWRVGPDKGPSTVQQRLSSMLGALGGLRECLTNGQRGRKGRATFAEARRASAARFSRPVASSGCGNEMLHNLKIWK